MCVDTKAALRFIRREYQRHNRARRNPYPLCADCEFPIPEAERASLYRHICCTCETNRVDELFRKAVRRIGRRRFLRVLRSLGR